LSSLNDLKHAALTDAGFTEGSLMDREYQWLAYQTLVYSGASLNDQWMLLLDQLGYTSGSINDRQMQAWDALTYTGAWNDRAMQFWDAGGSFGPRYVLLETGDKLLLETGDDLLME